MGPREQLVDDGLMPHSHEQTRQTPPLPLRN